MKSLRRLAVILDRDDNQCPFGLPIIQACLSAGNSVDDMIIITDAKKEAKQIKHNFSVLQKNVEPQKCKYAAHLFENKDGVVDCDFGDTAAGLSQDVSFVGSPYYTQIDKGLGIGGLLNYPVTYQTDGEEYRNMYYGLYGWASKQRQLRLNERLKALHTLKMFKS